MTNREQLIEHLVQALKLARELDLDQTRRDLEACLKRLLPKKQLQERLKNIFDKS